MTVPTAPGRMDNERIRAFCLALPHVTETLNWGHHLVYFVGDRDIGGKMFAITDLDGTGNGVLSFHCGAERFDELLETEGMAPALIYEKLPKRTKTILAMPEKEQARAIRERRKLMAERAKGKSG